MSNKTLKNTTAAPITLILTQTERVRVLPGQGAVITDAQLKLIKANSAAMTFITSGALVEV